MPEVEISKEDLKKLDKEIAEKIFGIEFPSTNDDGWQETINEDGTKSFHRVFPVPKPPPYSNDFRMATKLAQEVAEKKKVVFRLIFDPYNDGGKPTWKIDFCYGYGDQTSLMCGEEKDMENLPFRICLLSLHFWKEYSSLKKERPHLFMGSPS